MSEDPDNKLEVLNLLAAWLNVLLLLFTLPAWLFFLFLVVVEDHWGFEVQTTLLVLAASTLPLLTVQRGFR